MALTARVHAAINARLTGSPDLGTSTYVREGVNTLAWQFSNGTGNGQADRIFTDRRTIAASGNDDLDLAGTLADPLGGTAAFVEIVAIEVRAAATNTNNVVIGNAASNQFVGPFGAAAHTIAIPPGGVIVLHHPGAGWAVTAGTGDILRIANSAGGTSVTYDIVIIGRSA